MIHYLLLTILVLQAISLMCCFCWLAASEWPPPVQMEIKCGERYICKEARYEFNPLLYKVIKMNSRQVQYVYGFHTDKTDDRNFDECSVDLFRSRFIPASEWEQPQCVEVAK